MQLKDAYESKLRETCTYTSCGMHMHGPQMERTHLIRPFRMNARYIYARGKHVSCMYKEYSTAPIMTSQQFERTNLCATRVVIG